MKRIIKHVSKLRKLNDVLYSPVTLLIILGCMFAFFAFKTTSYDKANKDLLTNTNSIILDLKKVLCEGIPDEECQLAKAVLDLKADNAKQTAYISCILTVLGQNQIVLPEDKQNCQQMVEGVFPDPLIQPNADNQSQQSAGQPANNNQGGGQTTPPPAPDNRGLLERTVDGITQPVDDLLGMPF